MTLAEVAARAGVSPMTASRALGGAGASVSAAARQRVQRAAEHLGYRPNVAARQLAAAAPQRITLVYGNPSQAYLSELLVGALEEAATRGLQVGLARLEEALGGRRRGAGFAAAPGSEGVLLPVPTCDSEPLLQALARGGARWVALSPADPARHPLCVEVDDEEAASRMTRYLIGLGHRCIGFIGGEPAYRAAIERERGFRQSMAAAGLEPGPVETGHFAFEPGRLAAERILEREPRVTAIFASNDDMAAGALAAARRRGLDVPRQLTIAGFDDSPVAAIVTPAITTMRQPIAAMARAAVRLLADAQPGAARPRAVAPPAARQRFACSLVVRESSAPPAATGAARVRPRARRP